MTTLEVFRMVATEFNAIEDAEVQKWIELCTPLISKKIFGNLYEQALSYLTAHRMKLMGKDDGQFGSLGDTLRVNSYSEGQTSISFGNSQSTNLMSDGTLALTSYGLEYLNLRRLVVVPIRCSGEV